MPHSVLLLFGTKFLDLYMDQDGKYDDHSATWHFYFCYKMNMAPVYMYNFIISPVM